MNKKTPLILSTINLTSNDCNCSQDCNEQSYLSLNLTFLNKRAMEHSQASGIRRKVSVALIENKDNITLHTVIINVNIPKGDLLRRYKIDFPYSNSLQKHNLKITVTDINTGILIGDYALDDIADYSVCLSSGNENNEFTEPDFEKLLDDFITSQIETNPDEPTSEDYESEESMDEVPDITDSHNYKVEDSEPSFMVSLNQLTGLKSVKQKLSTYEKIVKFNKLRIDNNLPVDTTPLHAMFIGSPGTGKTTVAKRMGVMLRRAGVLSRGHLIVKERATLLGPYYSNEETNTIKAIEEAQGGILCIVEAYQLYQPNDPRDPGKFVIEALMTALADESKRDWMLILAGYPDEMRQMFNMNPGLKSRIPDSNIYLFEDFTEDELMEIAENYLNRNSYILSPEAHTLLSLRFALDYSTKDKSFGNARYVINLIQTEILPRMASRVVSESVYNADTLTVIQPQDIPSSSKMEKSRRIHIGFRA